MAQSTFWLELLILIVVHKPSACASSPSRFHVTGSVPINDITPSVGTTINDGTTTSDGYTTNNNTTTSGDYTTDNNTTISGDYTTDNDKTTSGDYATYNNTTTSADYSTDNDKTTSGDYTTYNNTTTSGDYTTDNNTTTSGDYTTNNNTITSGDYSTDNDKTTSGDYTTNNNATGDDTTTSYDYTMTDNTTVSDYTTNNITTTHDSSTTSDIGSTEYTYNTSTSESTDSTNTSESAGSTTISESTDSTSTSESADSTTISEPADSTTISEPTDSITSTSDLSSTVTSESTTTAVSENVSDSFSTEVTPTFTSEPSPSTLIDSTSEGDTSSPATTTSDVDTTSYTDSTTDINTPLPPNPDSGPTDVGLIIGIIMIIIVLGVSAYTWLMIRSGKLPWPPKNPFSRASIFSVRPQPIALKKFPGHCAQMLDTPSRLSHEFQLLATLSVDITATQTFVAGQENKHKNRYINILPYDSTRVILEYGGEEIFNDYVNASFIKGYSDEIEYIATQGPKEETCREFWQMVYQQGVKVIAMVTQLEERGKEKCYQYFPNLRENLVFGDITICCRTEIHFSIYTSRTLMLVKDDRKRSIIHLHFREWPDFGCPSTPDLMLQFCQVMRHHSMLSHPGITLVHCSAGVGRTGTLIAMDILLQNMKENRKVDIFGTVHRLRHQRVNMVQSEAQYVYLYQCIKEALENPSYLASGREYQRRPHIATKCNDEITEEECMELLVSITCQEGRGNCPDIEFSKHVVDTSDAEMKEKSSTDSMEPIYENVSSISTQAVYEKFHYKDRGHSPILEKECAL